MGLSQQIAFSSFLAFFPAMIFLVGLLDLFDAYGPLRSSSTARTGRGRRDGRDPAGGDLDGNLVVAFVVGASLATWAASGAMNRCSSRSTERTNASRHGRSGRPG